MANHISDAYHTLDLGLGYGYTPSSSGITMNGFVPCPSTKLGEFRIVGDKVESMGKPPASIFSANGSIEQCNRFFGAAYGPELIRGRGNARALPAELNRRRDVLYTPEVVRIAFGSTVRNFIDLVEEGISRMLRVTRNGIRRESLSDYALLPREDGPPDCVCPISCDMQSDTGFWRSEFIPRFDAKFENGLI